MGECVAHVCGGVLRRDGRGRLGSAPLFVYIIAARENLSPVKSSPELGEVLLVASCAALSSLPSPPCSPHLRPRLPRTRPSTRRLPRLTHHRCLHQP